ncbi:MAG TPA: NAD+ synthase [Candidatus Thermoplasmatota archaeon]|nr:NAD+ synthase [Candidatus Thermoplasmatota archaeon]
MGFLPAFDAAVTSRSLERFLLGYLERAGAGGFVVGVSGGVDSAVVAALAARAAPRRVTGLLLPHRDSNASDAEHARLVVAAAGIEHETVDVSGVVDAVLAGCRHGFPAPAQANLKARARMLVLYAHANAENRLVLGTGNKSELLQGYFTKYGDGAADVYPIGDVYKTHVWALARHLGVPAAVVEKPPTAGLWAGQTDEEELGIRYKHLDEVLAGFEAGYARAKVARDLALDEALVARVEERLYASEHKRTSLVVPKLSFRTPGLDWRLPRQARP